MNKLSIYTLFGIIFLSSILLGNGIYSNQVFAEENQTGTENEAEIEADIEQENKCKKDTECENENEINNQLNIVNQQQNTTHTGEPEPTCETCFTDNLTPTQITSFESEIFQNSESSFSSIQDLCNFLEQDPTNPDIQVVVADLLFGAGGDAGININTLNAIADCLDELYGITIPRGV